MSGADWNLDAEWLEADGRGGFASGTVSGERTRRYHAVLLCAPGVGAGAGAPSRMVLVNGFEVWLETHTGERLALSTQRYQGEVVYPRGCDAVVAFRPDPWPAWTYRFANGVSMEAELVTQRGTGLTLATWRVVEGGSAGVQLLVRPLLSGRDYHATHHENGAFDFHSEVAPSGVVAWRPYPGVPRILCWSDGAYRVEPAWYRNFLYRIERDRGLDCVEDLGSPGVFTWTLTAHRSRASLVLAADQFAPDAPFLRDPEADVYHYFRDAEAPRRHQLLRTGALGRAADAYLVRSPGGPTVIAGYPWFTDWGRDTFIALRGLCLATGRLEEAGEILVRWAGALDQGMLPNRFPDQGAAPEYNAVDASLWFVVVTHEYLAARRRSDAAGAAAGQSDGQAALLRGACEAILSAYVAGTRFGIGLDPADGLLRAGAEGYALTWMDARVNGRPVTPRSGKPVEIQALWLNALALCGAAESGSRWRALFEQGLLSFYDKFWMPAVDAGYLRDVVDCDHRPGVTDDTLRPNQLLAVGGLPFPLLTGGEASRLLAKVESQLLVPTGLRTLSPDAPGYSPRYEGGPAERDARYHQGPAWPWLLGAFVEAWVRLRNGTEEARTTARQRFLEPLRARFPAAGLGHLPELTDAQEPFTARGCPFQAWSVGEFIRLDRDVLAGSTPVPPADFAPSGAV